MTLTTWLAGALALGLVVALAYVIEWIDDTVTWFKRRR